MLINERGLPRTDARGKPLLELTGDASYEALYWLFRVAEMTPVRRRKVTSEQRSSIVFGTLRSSLCEGGHVPHPMDVAATPSAYVMFRVRS
jgi:hypothetical protein